MDEDGKPRPKGGVTTPVRRAKTAAIKKKGAVRKPVQADKVEPPPVVAAPVAAAVVDAAVEPDELDEELGTEDFAGRRRPLAKRKSTDAVGGATE